MKQTNNSQADLAKKSLSWPLAAILLITGIVAVLSAVASVAFLIIVPIAAKPFTPFLSLLCGSKHGEVVRIEKPTQGTATCARPTKRSPLLALSNHYIHRNHRKLNTETEWTDEEGQEWMNDTHERFCEVRGLAQEVDGCKRLPGLRTFEEEPVRNDNTVHLALMRPATNTLKFKNYAARSASR